MTYGNVTGRGYDLSTAMEVCPDDAGASVTPSYSLGDAFRSSYDPSWTDDQNDTTACVLDEPVAFNRNLRRREQCLGAVDGRGSPLQRVEFARRPTQDERVWPLH